MSNYRLLVAGIVIAMVAAACGGESNEVAATTTPTSTVATTTTAAPDPTPAETTSTTASPELPSELLWYAEDVSGCGLIAAVFADTVVYQCLRDTDPFRAYDIASGTAAEVPGFEKLVTLFDGTVVGSDGATVQVLDSNGERDRPAFTLPDGAEFLVGDFAVGLADTTATVTALDTSESTVLDVVSPPRNAEVDEAGGMIQYAAVDGSLLAFRGGVVERLDPGTLSPIWSVEFASADGSAPYVPSVWPARRAFAARHLVAIRTAAETAIIDLVTGEVRVRVERGPSKLMAEGVAYEESGGGTCSGSPVLTCYLSFDGSIIGSTGLEDNGRGILGPVTGLASSSDDVVVDGRFFVAWPGGGATSFAERDPAEVWSVDFETIGLFPQASGCDFASATQGLVGHCGGIPMLIK